MLGFNVFSAVSSLLNQGETGLNVPPRRKRVSESVKRRDFIWEGVFNTFCSFLLFPRAGEPSLCLVVPLRITPGRKRKAQKRPERRSKRRSKVTK